ncbi:tyrosine-type recombinase/integrase [Paenibacillus macquariensis]|uniref:Site-specific recombinase XerD n=1 Tax=Paenibacillus macquariensis TaxID=948756 RepID=A0ABY1KE71_9BACL|nr:site-specific integrase [Paenibacillus macquariensis]MEC0093426.1 site-specific integrase [Paenibacillus macquariensis]OAB38917.1 hypothetical protein PMSM_01125 [Paenibacillus macquariensis subsp. macquariensis]SIR69860.1 Site-specific recombinase XerD [Paenibacillus macquariensis]
MKNIICEIDDFIANINVELKTKKRYRKSLMNFAEFLSKKINTIPESVFLDKIFCIPFDELEEQYFYLQINTEIIDEYFELLVSGSYSNLLITKITLNQLFDYLELTYNQFENIIRDIDFDLRKHKPLRSHGRTFNRHEILKLLWSITKHSDNLLRDMLLFVTLCCTGCRINEILTLTGKKVLYDQNMFYLEHTKNKEEKYIVTRLGITKVFKVYCERNNIGPNDYIFTENSKPLTQRRVNKLLDKYLSAVNIPKATVHTTRRTFATILYESGVDLSIIQQLLNHLYLDSTKSYIEPHYTRNHGLIIPLYDEVYSNLKKLIGH